MGRAELKARARMALRGRFGVAVGGILLYYGVSFLISLAVQIVMMIAGSTYFSGLYGIGEVTGADVSGQADLGVLVPFIVVMTVLYVAMCILMYLLMPGLIRLYMNICNGEKGNVGDLFWAFRNKPGKFIKVAVLFLVAAAVIMLPVLVLTVAAAVSGEVAFARTFIMAYMVILMIAMIYASLTFAMFYYILVEDPQKGIIQALRESHSLMKGNRFRFFVLGISWLGWEILAMASFGIGYLWLLPYIYCTSVLFFYDLKPQIETIPPENGWNPYMDGYRETERAEIYEEPVWKRYGQD